MEALLVNEFATPLELSLDMTRPDAVKTQFDPATDKAEVMAVLGAGCDAVKKSFDIENIDLDGLIDTVMVDKQAAAGEIAGFKGIKFDDLHLAYKQLCKHETIDREVIDLDQVIEFYNRAATDLPDHNRLKGLKLPGMTTVLDGTGAKFAELFEPDNRRHWVPLAEVPEFVQKAFVAAEDKRFFEQQGVDVRRVTRAFMNTMRRDKRQGGAGDRRGGRAAELRHLRAGPPRHRLPSGRRDRTRGAGPCRRELADIAVLRGALDHPASAATRRRGGIAGRAGAI